MGKKQEGRNIRRQVFLHADDFGMNHGVTDGIIEGFSQGLLTSTSLLSNAPDADRALQLWKILISDQASARLPLHSPRSRLEDPFDCFDLGVHLNLTQGRPLTGNNFPAELLDDEGRFPGIFALFSRIQRHGVRLFQHIQAELARQVEFVIEHDLQPTHLNGHQYIEMIPAVAEMVPQLLSRYNIHVVRVAKEKSLLRSTLLRKFAPLSLLMAEIKRMFAKRFHRRMEQLDVPHPEEYFGTAHAGHIDMPLIRLFLDGQDSSSAVEIAFHPAIYEPPEDFDFEAAIEAQADGWNDPLAESRPNELRLLTSTELADHLEAHNYRLGRLADLAAA